jgi:hypothetical protein
MKLTNGHTCTHTLTLLSVLPPHIKDYSKKLPTGQDGNLQQKTIIG